MTFFGLKLGQNLEKWVAHPHQEFPGVSPPLGDSKLNPKKTPSGCI